MSSTCTIFWGGGGVNRNTKMAVLPFDLPRHFFLFLLAAAEQNSTKFYRYQRPSTKFVFLRAYRKTKMADLASDWLIHF